MADEAEGGGEEARVEVATRPRDDHLLRCAATTTRKATAIILLSDSSSLCAWPPRTALRVNTSNDWRCDENPTEAMQIIRVDGGR